MSDGAPPAPESPPVSERDPFTHVVVHAGGSRFALPLSGVREIAPPGMLARVPWAPHAVRGAMNLRGRIVTVVSLAEVLGVVRRERALRVVVLAADGGSIGLLVPEVESIESLPTVVTASEGGGPIVGRVDAPDGPIHLLDPDALSVRVRALFVV